MNTWLTEMAFSSLRSLGGSILSSLGPVGVIAMLAGGLLLVAVPLGLIRFASRPRGMVMAAAVLVAGVAMMGFAPKPAEPVFPPKEPEAKEVPKEDAKAVVSTPQKAATQEDAGELDVIGDMPVQPAMAGLPVAAVAPAIVPPVAMLGAASHPAAGSGRHAAATHTASHHAAAVAAAKPAVHPAPAVAKPAHAAAKTPATPAGKATPKAGPAATGKKQQTKSLPGSMASGSVAAQPSDRQTPKAGRTRSRAKGRTGADGGQADGMAGMMGGRQFGKPPGRHGAAAGNAGHRPAASRSMANRMAEAELNAMMGNLWNQHAGGMGNHPHGGAHPGQGLPHRGGHR